jgi:hypothetical protein
MAVTVLSSIAPVEPDTWMPFCAVQVGPADAGDGVVVDVHVGIGD